MVAMRGVIVFTILSHLATGEDLCWTAFGAYQYRILAPNGGRLFQDAVDYCVSINTSLASIHSQAEQDFLEGFMSSQMGVPLWIGLHRDRSGLNWADGTEVDFVDSSYTPKRTSEGCVYIFDGWNEESCSSANLHFICKRQASDSGACPTTTVATTSTTSLPDASTKPTTAEFTETDPADSTDGSTNSGVEETFEKMIEEMTIKKKPVYNVREGANSTAIGSVSILILVGIILGIILLDISTIRKHLVLIKRNTKDVCKRNNKTGVNVNVVHVKETSTSAMPY